MSFFLISTSSETKIIGPGFPQIETMGGTSNRNSSDSLYNVNSNAFPAFIPDLNSFIVNNSARLSDVLSASMISFGFIVNDKVKSTLTEFKLPPHKFYPATVEHKGSIYQNYYWFFFISDILDLIDYNKTKFFFTNLVNKKIEDCNGITSSALFRDLKDNLPFGRNIDSDLVCFDKSITEKYDLFKLPFGRFNTYISEKLYDAIKSKGITGFNISATEKIIV